MMKELDQLVENFFQPKQDTLGLDQLVEMIEQVLSEKISNRGDVAEGILVAAAAAKLAARNPDGTISNITPQDIQAFVQKLSGQGAKVTSDYPNYSIRCKDKNVEDDTITFSVELPQGPFKDLKDQSKYKLLEKEYQSAASYVNKELHKYATRLYTNCKSNKIEISGQGTKDQKGTKIDIFFQVDGKRISLQTSMKANSKQFGQKAGFKLEQIKDFFKDMGVSFDSKKMEQDFNLALQNIKQDTYDFGVGRQDVYDVYDQRQAIADAFSPFYEEAAKKMDGNFDTNAMIKAVRSAALGDEEDMAEKILTIQLLKLIDGDYKLIRFGKNLEKAIQNAEWKVEYEVSVTKDKQRTTPGPDLRYPYIRIYLVSGDKKTLVLSMRLKIEVQSANRKNPKTNQKEKVYQYYPRNYFQAEKGLFDIGKVRTK
jgi:hypothetical protein